jgi:hypothetical protein
MAEARELDPIFLFLHQFNEFTAPDEGFDPQTDDDIEPANLWGAGSIDTVRHQIFIYRCSRPSWRGLGIARGDLHLRSCELPPQ